MSSEQQRRIQRMQAWITAMDALKPPPLSRKQRIALLITSGAEFLAPYCVAVGVTWGFSAALHPASAVTLLVGFVLGAAASVWNMATW